MTNGALSPPSRGAAAYLAWGVICFVWGTTYLANKFGIHSFPPLLLCGVRFMTGGVILQSVGWVRRRRSGGDGLRMPLSMGLLGILTLGVGTGMTVWAQQWLATGLTAVLTAGTPFWMVLVESLAPAGARPTWKAVGGLVLGLCGILLIAWGRPDGSFRADYLWAVGAVLTAGVSWAIGSILTRHQKGAYDALTVAAAQMLWAGSALLVASFVAGERMPASLDLKSVVALAYLVVFGSCVAFVCYLYALRHLPVAFVSTHTYVNPLLALWLGWLVLDESLTVYVLGATILIFAGLVLTRARRSRREPPLKHGPDRSSILRWKKQPTSAVSSNTTTGPTAKPSTP